MIPLEEAVRILEDRVELLPGEESVPLTQARGRILAREITFGHRRGLRRGLVFRGSKTRPGGADHDRRGHPQGL